MLGHNQSKVGSITVENLWKYFGAPKGFKSGLDQRIRVHASRIKESKVTKKYF